MKFSCDRDPLLKEIAIAQEVISSRNALSILSNVYLETSEDGLSIKATDLKVSFETMVPANVEGEGATTVYCDKLLGILRSLPGGEIHFDLSDDLMLTIQPVDRRIDFSLRCISPDKYPEQQKIPEELYSLFPQKDLNDMVAKTAFAVSDDETRYFLNGVYLESTDAGFHMVATDGKRLSLITKTGGIGASDLKGVIVPPKIFHLMRKLSTNEGNLSIAITEKSIFLKFGPYEISSNLIDAQFPDYGRVIPEHQDKKIVVETELLDQALRRVSLLVEQKSKKLLMTAGDNNLRIHSVEGEIGRAVEELPCEYPGDEVTFAVNYMYVMEPLREMESDKVCLEFSESDKAITLTSEPRTDFFHIVMPMQQP